VAGGTGVILVDTSIWIDHLRSADTVLIRLLEAGEVMTHPFIIGELACGNLRKREEVLSLLHDLPQANVADHEEMLFLIERHDLMGLGIGYVDVHLLASTLLTSSTLLWTRDKRLGAVAGRLHTRFSSHE
jgi:predicted nucleic acid-binding protein